MGFMVGCGAGAGVGEHWVPVVSQLWAQEHGQALESWERWLIMAAEISSSRKRVSCLLLLSLHIPF